jgi:hypothetical protein
MPRSSGSKTSATAAQSTAAVAGMLQQVARTHEKRAATQFTLKK